MRSGDIEMIGMAIWRTYLLPMLVFAVGLIFAFIHDQSYSFRWFLLGYGLMLAILMGRLVLNYQQVVSVPLVKSLGFYVVFLCWSIIALSWTPVFGDGFLTWLVFSSLLLGAGITVTFNSKQCQLFRSLLGVLLLLNAGKSMYQAMALGIQRPTGFFSDWNTNGIYMVMLLLPICGEFLAANQHKKRRVVLGLISAVGGLAIGFTLSRGAILGFLVGLSILVIANYQLKLSQKNILTLLAWLLAGFLLSDYLNQSFNQDTLLGRMANSSNIVELSNGRDKLWLAGWQMYLEKPVFGWGVDMFHWLFPQYRQPDFPNLGQLAHNDYLQVLIELGPVGLVLFLGFVVYFFRENWLLYWKTPEKPEKMENVALFAGCVAVFVHSIVNFNIYQAPMMVMLGFYMGILIGKQREIGLLAEYPIICGRYVSKIGFYGFVSLAVIVVGTWFVLFYMSLNAAYGPRANASLLNRIDGFEQASRLLPYREEYPASFADQVVVALGYSYKDFVESDIEMLISIALHEVEKAIQKNPYRGLNFYNKGQLLQYKNKVVEAVDANLIQTTYEEAVRLDPYNLQYRMGYANYLGSIGGKQKAQNVLEQGLGRTYYENYGLAVEYMKFLRVLYLQLGEDKKATIAERQIDDLLALQGNAQENFGGLFSLAK